MTSHNDKPTKEELKAFKAGFYHGVALVDWFGFKAQTSESSQEFTNSNWDKDMFERPMTNKEIKARIKNQKLGKLPAMGFMTEKLPKKKSLLERFFE